MGTRAGFYRLRFASVLRFTPDRLVPRLLSYPWCKQPDSQFCSHNFKYLCTFAKTILMNPFFTETVVRWSDLDANMHLANASYMNFTSFARIAFLRHCGIKLSDLATYKIGPAVLREEFSFFREAHEGQEVMISVAVSGNSENGEIFEFEHNLYDKKTGTHLAYSRVFGVWFSMTERKKMPPPAEMQEKINANVEASLVRKLSLSDLKSLPVHPKNIDPKTFNHA